jgi:hypothetical protein
MLPHLQRISISLLSIGTTVALPNVELYIGAATAAIIAAIAVVGLLILRKKP